MPPFIINVAGAAGAFTGGWLRSFRQKCPLSAGGRCFSNGEPHRVLPADRKAAGMHSLKGRTARSRCMRTVRIFGKTGGKPPDRFGADFGLSGRSFIRRGRGWLNAYDGGWRPGRFGAPSRRKQTFVHVALIGSSTPQHNSFAARKPAATSTASTSFICWRTAVPSRPGRWIRDRARLRSRDGQATGLRFTCSLPNIFGRQLSHSRTGSIANAGCPS